MSCSLDHKLFAFTLMYYFCISIFRHMLVKGGLYLYVIIYNPLVEK
jgi:hypothetical protein